jgi:DNA-binding MarR family transcriptional regulator
MVVQCSEDAKTALNHVSFRNESGGSPVHTIESFWPLQRCPVQAVLSRERTLSLLEKYTLRAFNEIPEVSAAEIAIKLGLKEPELIQETLDSLVRAGAIKTRTGTIQNEEISELQESLDRLLLGLNANAYSGAVRRNMERKVERLQAQIEQQGNPRRLSFREKITAHFKRLLGFKASVTPEGKDQLAKGKIVEPTTTEHYDLVRCLGTNNLIALDDGALSGRHLQRLNANNWLPIEETMRKPSHPVKGEVEKALREADNIDEVNILSLESVNDSKTVDHLPICITLSVSHENGSPIFFVHRRGSSQRLSWIENFLYENKEAEMRLLNRFKDQMKIKTKLKATSKPHEVEPLVSASAHVKRNISSSSKSMLLLNNHEDLLRELSCLDDYPVLVQNRTLVTYPQGLKKIKVKSQDSSDGLMISIPPSESKVPSYTIATQDFMLQLVSVNVQARQNKGFEVSLPAVVFSEESGSKLLSETNTYLRKMVEDPKERYLFTRSMPDFVEWLRKEVNGMKSISEVGGAYRSAMELCKGSTFNLFQIFMDAVFSECMGLFEPDMMKSVDEFMKQFSTIEDTENCWPLFEPKLQQSIFQSVISEGSNRTLAETWQAHSSGEKRLPWEDAARLEYAWVGHCDNTKFNASRFFEETVLELAGSKDMTTENVAKALAALKDKQILSETLFSRADLVRRERNRYAHTAGLNAELEYTLRLIAVMRELAELGQPSTKGSWQAEKGTQWESTLTVSELEDYVEKASDLIKKNAHHPSSGHVWVVSLLQSLPPLFEDLPLKLMQQLADAPEVQSGPQFKHVLEKILQNGLSEWIQALPKSPQFELPESMVSLMTILDSAGMEKELGDLKNSYLDGLEKLTSYADLQTELAIVGNETSPLTSADFSIRWKRSVKERNFQTTFNDLASMEASHFSLLATNVKGDLFMQAIRTELKRISSGDAQAIKSLCDELQSFTGKENLWHSTALAKDGFAGAEMGNKIRASGDPIANGILVNNLMPFVDEGMYPKINAQLELIVQRGEKEAKKKEEEKK